MKKTLALVLALSVLFTQTAFATTLPTKVGYKTNATATKDISCIEGAAKGAAVAVVGGGVLVLFDCLFTFCAFTAAALAAGGGLGGAAILAGVTGSTYGCASALVN